MINYPCLNPCPNYVEGATDPKTDMVQCVRCGMWFSAPPEPEGEGDG